jgi:fructokinase
MRIVSIGEILWDVFGDVEHLGGAAFNFAAHARRLGHDVVFISAVGSDDRGLRALDRMAALGLPTNFVQIVNAPTGAVTVELDAAGQPDFTIHRPAAYNLLDFAEQELQLDPDWIYFGTLHQFDPRSREVSRRLLAANPYAKRFYDVNLRPRCYTPVLVAELVHSASVAKLNEHELAQVEEWFGKLEIKSMCVTRGENGCAIQLGDDRAEVPGYAIEVADTVGSGDAFAAAVVHGLGQGWSAAQIGDFANRVGALVASRPGAIPDWTIEEALALLRR